MKEIKENSLFETKNSKDNSVYIFQKWKQLLKKTQLNKFQELAEKKELLSSFRFDYDQVIKNREFTADKTLVFNLANFVRLIKYLNASNSFFNYRFTTDNLDEILLLVYIYEWVCLQKEKDESILGKKDDVIKKFKFQVYNSNSEYKKIFENIDLDFEDSFLIFKERIAKTTWATYDKLMKLIANDNDFFLKVDKEIVDSNYVDNESACLKLWKETFELYDDKFSYIYSAKNSDDEYIYILVEQLNKNETVAVIKYKMFNIFSYKNGILVQTSIGKEFYSLEHINKKIPLDSISLLSKSVELANIVIDSIFWKDVKFKQEDVKKIVNIKPKS